MKIKLSTASGIAQSLSNLVPLGGDVYDIYDAAEDAENAEAFVKAYRALNRQNRVFDKIIDKRVTDKYWRFTLVDCWENISYLTIWRS